MPPRFIQFVGKVLKLGHLKKKKKKVCLIYKPVFLKTLASNLCRSVNGFVLAAGYPVGRKARMRFETALN